MNPHQIGLIVEITVPGLIGILVVAKGLGWFGKKKGLDPIAQAKEDKINLMCQRLGAFVVLICVVWLAVIITRN